MRKDTIEARITGIEREIQELRSEIRQELKSMATDLREFQEVLLDERMGEIQGALSTEYRHIAYENYLDETRQRFEEELSRACSPRERTECISHLVDVHLRGEVERLDGTPPELAAEARKVIVDYDNRYQAGNKGTICEGCMSIYAAERDRLLELTEQFASYRKSLTTKRGELYFRQLPDDLVVSQIVEPLSHRARFAMLKCLTSRGTTFKELGEVTGYDGGHLVYHLNKLVAAGLAAKDEASGLYQITEKGTGVMEIVKKMYEQ